MKETSMSSERKVAVITGASQGMGAALVEAYRDRDYGVVATARSIGPTNDDQILAVPGDITGRNVNQAVFVGFSHILGNVLGIYRPISVVPRPSAPAPRGYLGNVICTPCHKCC